MIKFIAYDSSLFIKQLESVLVKNKHDIHPQFNSRTYTKQAYFD